MNPILISIFVVFVGVLIGSFLTFKLVESKNIDNIIIKVIIGMILNAVIVLLLFLIANLIIQT